MDNAAKGVNEEDQKEGQKKRQSKMGIKSSQEIRILSFLVALAVIFFISQSRQVKE